ncbi:hypothetical protein COCNU_scaffold004692G000030 [Cocos nucifera]|nr:hypothetical protein [Cocos nucifera]
MLVDIRIDDLNHDFGYGKPINQTPNDFIIIEEVFPQVGDIGPIAVNLPLGIPQGPFDFFLLYLLFSSGGRLQDMGLGGRVGSPLVSILTVWTSISTVKEGKVKSGRKKRKKKGEVPFLPDGW